LTGRRSAMSSASALEPVSMVIRTDMTPSWFLVLATRRPNPDSAG
jgi:hypothetical protein